jgi:hypothetical protein
MADEEMYGAGLPFFDALKLLAQYGPLLGRLQAVAAAEAPYDRAVAVVHALKWAAAKSERTQVDDEAVDHLQAVLATPEGKAFFEWICRTIGGAL